MLKLAMLLLLALPSEAKIRSFGGGLSATTADANYVNVTGDTMTGQLTNKSTITVQGTNNGTIGYSLRLSSGIEIGAGGTGATIDSNSGLMIQASAGNILIKARNSVTNGVYTYNNDSRVLIGSSTLPSSYNNTKFGVVPAAFHNYVVVVTSVNPATSLLVVTSSGNVGIGTKDPKTLLDVNGGSQFGSESNKSTITAAGALNMALGAGISLRASGNVGVNATGGANLTLGTDSGTVIITPQNAVSRPIIMASQINSPVFVGTAASPGYINASFPSKFQVVPSAVHRYSVVVTSQSGVSTFVIDAVGNVGLSTPTPSTRLSVYGIITSSTPIPSISCNAGTGVMASRSTDQHGEFVAGAAAANCTITFTQTWPKKPNCWCNDETNIVVVRATPTTTTLKCDVAIDFGGDTIQYGCMGAP